MPKPKLQINSKEAKSCIGFTLIETLLYVAVLGVLL